MYVLRTECAVSSRMANRCGEKSLKVCGPVALDVRMGAIHSRSLPVGQHRHSPSLIAVFRPLLYTTLLNILLSGLGDNTRIHT